MKIFNISFSRIIKLMLIGLLLIIPIGMGYRIFEMFQLESAGVDSEWMNLILIFLFVVELYLLLIFIWLKLIFHRKMDTTFKFIQLLLIFIIGVLPGIIAIYPAFFKE